MSDEKTAQEKADEEAKLMAQLEAEEAAKVEAKASKGKAKDAAASAPASDTRKRKLCETSGWQQGYTMHPAGAEVEISANEERMLESIGLLVPKRTAGPDGSLDAIATNLVKR